MAHTSSRPVAPFVSAACTPADQGRFPGGAPRARHLRGYHGPPDAHRLERLRPPSHALRVQPPRRPRTDHGAGRRGERQGLRQPRPDRPWRALRLGRISPGGGEQGHQADHRRRDVHRSPVHDRQGGQGRRPAVPPRAPGDERDRLSQPVPPRHRRAHRRLLLQAADRPGAPRAAQRGPRRAVGLPQRRDLARPRGRRLGPRPQRRRRVRRDLRRGPLLPRAPGPRPAGAAAAQRAAPASRSRAGPAPRRHQRPALRQARAGPGPRRAAVRRHGVEPRHARPPQVRDRRILPEVRRGHGGPVPGPARGDHQHQAHRRDVRAGAAAGSAAHPALPGARWRDGRVVAQGEVPEGARVALRHAHDRDPGAPRLRARGHHLDGLRGLLPDRRRLRARSSPTPSASPPSTRSPGACRSSAS